MRVALRLLAILGVAASLSAQNQPPFLLKDINTGTAVRSSNPSKFTKFGTNALFIATSAFSGTEVFKTDGSAAGTTLAADLFPGRTNGAQVTPGIVVAGATAYVVGTDGQSGNELYKTDGTPAGTALVKDICPGTCTSTPSNLTNVFGVLYFTANDGTNGTELWRSDGTTAGTVMVKDLRFGSSSSNPSNLIAFNGHVLFTADDGIAGTELWVSDGTTSGTLLVKDINPSGSSSIAALGVVGGTVYFAANDGGSQNGLWKTDGTPLGTFFVAPVVPVAMGFGAPNYFVVNGAIVFQGSGNVLMRSDGTAPGTLPIGTCANLGAAMLGPTLYFAGVDANGTELWKTDGTAPGTVIVRDIANGPASSNPSSFVVAGSNLFFTANDGSTGIELWKSDGTALGTSLTRDIAPTNSSPGSICALDTRVVFAANDGTEIEPWISDGTAGGTNRIADLNPNLGSSMNLSFGVPTLIGGKLLFAARTVAEGAELWSTDGSRAGTLLLNDINPGPADSSPFLQPDGVVNGVDYFSAIDPTNGRELWKTDGTLAGTTFVADVNPGPDSSFAAFGYAASYQGLLFFEATDLDHGDELWKTDGTAPATVLVKDINSSPNADAVIHELVVLNDVLFFAADSDGTHATTSLWKTDGTEGGTVFVQEIGSQAGLPGFNGLTNLSGTLVFGGTDGTNGEELWVSNGSTAGTQVLKDINPGSASSSPFPAAIFNGKYYFSATTAAEGRELWSTDGTLAGTALVKDINPGPGGSSGLALSGFAGLGTFFVFAATDGVTGTELWRSDGTSAGTTFVKDICPGNCNSNPAHFTVAGGKAYFRARDRLHGEELWVTDGTSAGTLLVQDFEPGPGGSLSTTSGQGFFGLLGNLLLVHPETTQLGDEPWIVCSAPVTHYGLSAPASTISGTSISLGVTPLDASQAGVPCYIGTVHFTSSDPALALPADYTFTVSEGPHTFSLTPRTPGPQSVTVTDTVTGAILSTIVINVSASPTQSTITANPSTNLAANGSAASTITVQYKDVNGVNLTSGGGTVTLSTTHGTLTTPVNHNDGTWTASLTATQLGTATISGTIDGVAMTSTATVQFVAGAPAAFILSAPANASTGVPFSVTVTAKDANDNTIDGYNGTVFFVSNDSASPTLPADYTFVAGDHGVHTFTNGVVFHSVGNLSLFVGDRAAPGITGNAIIAVKGATTTVVTSNVNPAGPGVNVTLTATVSTDAAGPAMTGDVTFMDGATTLTTTPISGGIATFSTTSLARRPHHITAIYAGDTNYVTSTSSDFVQYITLAATTMTATYSPAQNNVLILWTPNANATSCQILKSSNHGAFLPLITVPQSNAIYQDTSINPNTIYLYMVRFLDSGGNPGDPSSTDPAATFTFVNDPASSTTVISAAQATQVRAAIDAYRAAAGLGVASYTNAINAGSPVRALDWTEMRARLEEARAAIPNLTLAAPYTDSTLTIGLRVKGAHLNDLRNRMK